MFLINYVYFSYYLSRADEVLGAKEFGFITIIDSFQVFLKRSMFGISIGTMASYGFVSSALSNIG